MRARRNTILKAFLALVLCLGMLIAVVPAAPASAAKMTNKKAQKILKKKIKNKFCKYTFVDLDKDKIDEMIVFGYSGKFVDGDDSEKTITVYKISGKKAKAVLSDSLKGDFYSPEFSFNAYYYDKKSYLTVHEVHEGYSFHTTYVYKNGKYTSYAGTSEEISEEDTVYNVEDKVVTKAEFNNAMEKIFKNELSYEMKLCDTKTANKYIKNMLKDRYDRLAQQDAFAEGAKYKYEDFDNDGLFEMIVETGKDSGIILFPSGKTSASSAFGASRIDYTLDADGDYVWGWNSRYYDMENGTALYYTGRWIAENENNFYIDVVREGDRYVFHIQYYPNAFDSEEWIYFTDYLGESEDLMVTFSCLDGGTHTSSITDRTTGEVKDNFEYVGGSEFYISYGEGMTWLDLDNPLGFGNGVIFEQVRNDD